MRTKYDKIEQLSHTLIAEASSQGAEIGVLGILSGMQIALASVFVQMRRQGSVMMTNEDLCKVLASLIVDMDNKLDEHDTPMPQT